MSPLFQLVLLFCADRVSSVSLTGHSKSRTETLTETTFDYVIVGGGLTGLVVANRLSENPNSKLGSPPTCISIANCSAPRLCARH
jgi:hypothetical protein